MKIYNNNRYLLPSSRTSRAFGSLFILVLMWVVSVPVEAEIYKYLGNDGTIHFTDRPMAGNYRLVWKSSSSTPPDTSAYSLAGMKQNKSRLTPLIEQTAKQLRLHPGLLHAVVLAESAYNPQAKSKKGAQGLMQLMPGTASRYGVKNAYDPKQNLQGGARYLKDLLTMFKFDLKLALAAYNAGENAVKKYGNQIPPYPETQKYVKKVMGYYRDNMLAMN